MLFAVTFVSFSTDTSELWWQQARGCVFVGGFSMPIRKFLKGQVFDPETLAAMSRALTDACQSVGRKVIDNEETRAIAARIVEAARDGERDPEKFKAAALKGLRH
jgi:hypothetical protein